MFSDAYMDKYREKSNTFQIITTDKKTQKQTGYQYFSYLQKDTKHHHSCSIKYNKVKRNFILIPLYNVIHTLSPMNGQDLYYTRTNKRAFFFLSS